MENSTSLPITFQMALAHNKDALKAFLKLPDEKQNNIINEAKNIPSVREMNIFVSKIPKSIESQNKLI